MQIPSVSLPRLWVDVIVKDCRVHTVLLCALIDIVAEAACGAGGVWGTESLFAGKGSHTIKVDLMAQAHQELCLPTMGHLHTPFGCTQYTDG